MPFKTIYSKYFTEIPGLRIFLWIILASLFLVDGLEHPQNIGTGHDWTFYLHHINSALLSYTKYHQFPVWDPYFCGGMVAIGNVQTNIISPNFLFFILFGLLPGMKISILVMFIIGLEGMYQIAKFKGISGVGALIAAPLFCFSGRFVRVFIDGHLPFLGFLLLPWILLSYEKSLRSSYRWILVGGFFMAWVFCEGGAIPTPLIALMLLVIMFSHIGNALIARIQYPSLSPPLKAEVNLKTLSKPITVLLLMGIVTICLSAIRFLPVMETLLDVPRVWVKPESYSINHILGMLFNTTRNMGYYSLGSSYVGTSTLFLFIFAIYMRDKTSIVLLVFAAIFAALATGDNGLFRLYDLLKHLPFFENLRNPFRYTFIIAFFLALGAGRGLQLLEYYLLKWLNSAWLAKIISPGSPEKIHHLVAKISVPVTLVLVLITAILSVWEPFAFNQKQMRHIFSRTSAKQVQRPFAQAVGNRWDAHVWPAANLGTIYCFEEQPFATSPSLRGDLEQEEYLLNPKKGSVQRHSWSPHRIELKVNLKQDAKIVVNQNQHRGWRVSRGEIVDHDGLLAVDAPKGEYLLEFTFNDPLITVGTIISWLTICLILGLVVFTFAQKMVGRQTKKRSPSD